MATKYNIKVQYAAWLAAATLAVVVVFTVVQLYREVEIQRQVTQDRADLAARTLAKVVENGMASHKKDQVIIAVSGGLADDRVQFLRIKDRAGEVFFSEPEKGEPKKLILSRATIGKMPYILGTVEVGVAPVDIGQRLMLVVLQDLGLGLLLLVVFVGGSLWVSAPVRDSLRDLLAYVKQVGDGEAPGEPLQSDLTEVDQVAHELNQLMTRVAESQRKLTKAQQALKATQKEMDEYTYVISHDLKEPLRGIEAFSKFLVDDYKDRLDEQGQYKLDVIRKSVVRMQRLITDLLKFSRMSQQRKPMEAVGLNTMLMRVRVNLQYALDAKKADLRVDKLPMVICDETALTEVFHNLISNAIKYNNNPLPVIEIGCADTHHPDTGEPEHQFYVRDNGAGIKKDYFDKIFQIFQRLNPNHDDGGTGIGLTIVRRVVEWHGGRIWLESEEGKGTTFYFTLPKHEISKTGTIIETPTTETKGNPELARTV